MTKPPKEIEKLIEAKSEAHMAEFFKRNDLPGPGSTHNQIYAAGFREGYSFRDAEVRELVKAMTESCLAMGTSTLSYVILATALEKHKAGR